MIVNLVTPVDTSSSSGSTPENVDTSKIYILGRLTSNVVNPDVPEIINSGTIGDVMTFTSSTYISKYNTSTKRPVIGVYASKDNEAGLGYIQTTGIVTVNTSLQPGYRYYVRNDGLLVTDKLNTSTGVNYPLLGVSLTSTEILLLINNDI